MINSKLLYSKLGLRELNFSVCVVLKRNTTKSNWKKVCDD